MKRFAALLVSLLAGLMVLPSAASAQSTTQYQFEVAPPSPYGPLPDGYRFKDYWQDPPLYYQKVSPSCVAFATTTAMTALTELHGGEPHLFDGRALWRSVPHTKQGAEADAALDYVSEHGLVDTDGSTWLISGLVDRWGLGVTTWSPGHYVAWNLDQVKRSLLRYHVLVADIVVTEKITTAIDRNPIDVGGKRDVADGPHEITVTGWNSHGLILQSTWGHYEHHWHSRWVVTWAYWQKYAIDLYGFTLVEEGAT